MPPPKRPGDPGTPEAWAAVEAVRARFEAEKEYMNQKQSKPKTFKEESFCDKGT